MVEDRATLDGHMVVYLPNQIDDRDVLHAEKALVAVAVDSSHTLYKINQHAVIALSM